MRTCTLVIALVFLLSAGSASTTSTGDAVASLCVNEPLEAVVASLGTLLPPRMEQEGMPGVAIALVRAADVAGLRLLPRIRVTFN